MINVTQNLNVEIKGTCDRKNRFPVRTKPWKR